MIRNERKTIESVNDTTYVTLYENTTLPLALHFNQVVSQTTAAADADADTNQVVVTSATGILVGHQIIIISSTQNRLTDSFIIDVTGTTITVSTPFEYDVKAGDAVTITTVDINVDGSTTPESFKVENLGAAYQSPAVILNTMEMVILTDTAIEYTDFGDIAGGLANGMVLRKNDGIISNFATARTNGDLRLYASDYEVLDASNPGTGVYGLFVKFDVAGLANFGVSVKLEPGEALELLVQDDLTSLGRCRFLAKGHLDQLR